mmetsp:Transcript_22324/g.34975  ORF Transcript_22324/g.34975 Transcript_22324/m.34975 type:complete len:339 (+) Transcript_22324:455-1471(+)|eukprot:CAMPEP_0184317882 /NCGR_PEP_ID=MMETSP1049-20130417/99302_1 /TAXON_ID=77928 /ORGANISM="Proteomonas sulcata, Strain CCMP704" /LENGTH=338 /DNA_ID=CAMNT_0026637433 /DNA_START=441 /DNA_END=1457 /DNA_ORIENTATION=+
MWTAFDWKFGAWVLAFMLGYLQRTSAFLLSPLTPDVTWIQVSHGAGAQGRAHLVSSGTIPFGKADRASTRRSHSLRWGRMTAVEGAGELGVVVNAGAAPVVDTATVDEWMDDVWRGRDGHCASNEEEAMIGEDSGSGEIGGVYGEITPEGFRTLMHEVGLGAHDVFMDLGSGVGRTVLHAWLEFGVLQSCGVEMSPSRHARAERALAEISTLVERMQNKCELGAALQGIGSKTCTFMDSTGLDRVVLAEGNMLDFDIMDATVIWLSSLCFSEDFMRILAAKLSSEAPLLRTVATLSEFPDGLEGFFLSHTEELPMSWNANNGGTTNVYVYSVGLPEED